ncbi:histone-lysine N-methyltransferase SETMAR [Trichonephila clavipes]|nr:histone-lysine N-methyltransferase SETMAR [Trichonephila clavipes]
MKEQLKQFVCWHVCAYARNFAKTESAITVQRAFRIKFGCQPPNDNNILRWYHQFETTGCLCKGKNENASQVAAIVSGIYGADIVTIYYVQFWIRRFRSCIFDVKVGPHTGRSVIKNDDKITEITQVGRHVSSHSIAQELKIDHKPVLSPLSKVGFKRKLDVWVPHQLTPKNLMDRISICEALAKRNEIDPFIKQMVTGDEK